MLNILKSAAKRVLPWRLKLHIYEIIQTCRSDVSQKIIPITDKGQAERLGELIRDALVREGVEFVFGGSLRGGTIRLNVRQAEAQQVICALSTIVENDPSVLVCNSKFRVIKKLDRLAGMRKLSFNIACVRQKTNANRPKDVFASILEVAGWRKVDNIHGPKVVGACPNSVVSSSVSFSSIARLGDLDEWQANRGDPVAQNFPIDVVYTWVDDTDPKWQENKAAHAGKPDAANLKDRTRAAERYRNRNELKYSLRSLEMFAPFVRNIYLVTAGQVPDWLDTGNPEIRVVDHSEIYADRAHLPTFNSSSIETQLHHIPGLAEHFLYMNDDFFFGNWCERDKFFAPNGIVRFFPGNYYAIPELLSDSAEEYVMSDKNVVMAFRQRLGISPSNIMLHVPYACRKSVLEELESEYADLFETCARQKFRSPNDIRPIAFMHPHYAAHKGLGIRNDVQQAYVALSSPNLKNQLKRILSDRHLEFFCLNDARGLNALPQEEIDGLVADFLESYFPIRSRFELK